MQSHSLSLRHSAVAAVLVCALAGVGRADVITQYNFNAAANNTGETGAGYSASLTDPRVTATAVAAGANPITTTIDLLTYSSRVLRVDPDGSSANAAAAVTNNKYFAFTVSASAGHLLDLDSLTFDAARGGTSTPRGWVVRSSVDGFAANLGTAAIATVRPSLTAYTVDLSAPQFNSLSAITFRLYTFSPGNGSTVEYDNLTVNGIVAPEPASLTLLGVAGLALAGGAWRRRKQAARG